MKSEIRIERTYSHGRAKVWRALTEPDLLSAWLMPNDFAPRLGHKFTFRTDPGPGFDGIVHCEVRELDPPSRMVWTWRGGPIDTVVTFELTEVEGGTRLRMTQSGFRGIRGWLIRRILELGSRSLYGKRLPALLDRLEGGAQVPAPGTRQECMTSKQRRLEWLLRLVPSRAKSESH